MKRGFNEHDKLPKKASRGRVTCKGTVGSIRAQVTIFIIIGILIIGIAGGITYTIKVQSDAKLNNEFFSQENIKPQVNNIQSSIINCMQDTSSEALDTIAVQGGYYNKPTNPESYVDLGWAFVPYYYNQGTYLMPSKEKIISEIENSVNDNLKLCIDNLEFNNFKLDYNPSRTRVLINKDNILFNIGMDVTIKREDKKITLDLKDYPVTINSALDDILEVAEYYTEGHKQDSELYCIECLGEMVDEKNLYVDLIDFGEQSTLVIISENYTSSQPYSFTFLNKYTGEEISPGYIPIKDDGYEDEPAPEAENAGGEI